jgi:small GTP-binding protein
MCRNRVDVSEIQIKDNSDGGHLGDSKSNFGGGDGDSNSGSNASDGNNNSESEERSLSEDRDLTKHELQVLTKGLQDATRPRSKTEIQEEEQEKLDAEAEEEERLKLASRHSHHIDETHTQSSVNVHSPGNVLASMFGRSSNSNGNSRQNSTDSNNTDNSIDSNDSNSSSNHSSPRSSVSSDGGGTPTSTSTSTSTSSPIGDGVSRSSDSVLTIKQKYTLGAENHNMRRFKVLLLGDSGVGKSSLMLRWTEDKYRATLTGTVGVNFKSKKVVIDSEPIQVQVWDTAGQQQFHKITTSYYKGANGIMVVYDVSDPDSLANVEYWIKNIELHASNSVHIVLVGTKTDLRYNSNTDSNTDSPSNNSNNPIICSNFASGKSIADKFHISYFETSSLESTGIDDAFMNIARFCVGVEDNNHSLLQPIYGIGYSDDNNNNSKSNSNSNSNSSDFISRNQNTSKYSASNASANANANSNGGIFSRMLGRKGGAEIHNVGGGFADKSNNNSSTEKKKRCNQS